MSDKVTREFPFHGVEEQDDNRFYLIDGKRLMSVTTALNGVDTSGLTQWAASLAADLAFAELPAITAASRKVACGNGRRCPETDHDWRITCPNCPCGTCKQCVRNKLAFRHRAESKRRADEGTRTHNVAEEWVLTDGDIAPHDDDIKPYVESFLQFVADYGIQPEDFIASEALVVHYGEKYAGTTDGILRLHADRTDTAAKDIARLTGVPAKKAAEQHLTVVVIIDYKTREKPLPKLYPNHALQLAGYRFAPVLRIKTTGQEVPMPACDGGMVIQLRPDGYCARLVVCDEDTYQRGFLPALRQWLWWIESGPASVSSHTFVLPETLAARERKALKDNETLLAGAAPVTAPATTAVKPARAKKTVNAGPARASTVDRIRAIEPFALANSGPTGDDIPF